MEVKGRNFTLADFEREVEKCRKQLIQLGYKGVAKKEYILNINNRFRTTMGMCTYLKGWSKFKIEINEHFANTADIWEIRDVIMHEVCHTIKGCRGHSGKWKEVITRVNETFGYAIEQCVAERCKGYKYMIKCAECGGSCFYKNKVRIVRELEELGSSNYCCGNCSSLNLQLYIDDKKEICV